MQLKSASRVFGLAMLLSFVAVTYQNCMPNLPDKAKQDESSTGADGTPFAFETKVDQLAYMSCTNLPTNHDKKTYFTFRVKAANGKSGVGVSAAFRTFLADRELTSNRDAQVSLLNESQLNRASSLQLSVRPDGALRTSVEVTNAQPNPFENIGQSSWGYLSDYDLAKQILAAVSTSAIPIKQYASSPLVLDVNYATLMAGAEEDDFHKKLAYGQKSFLVLGYGAGFGDSNERIVSPLDVEGATPSGRETVYGRGFQFQYSLPYRDLSTPNSNAGVERVIVGVKELDLANRTTQPRNWICRRFLDQYKIVPNDPSLAAQAGCDNPQGGISTPVTSDDVQSYNLANSLLNVGGKQWIIDAVHRCVFPNQPGSSACYATGAVEWDFSQPCGQPGQKECAHYVSMCTISN